MSSDPSQPESPSSRLVVTVCTYNERENLPLIMWLLMRTSEEQ